MEEKNKPGETVLEPGESERISAERKAALQDIDRKREEKEKLRQTQKQEAVKVHGSLSAYMNWPLLVCISLLILSIIITMIDWMAGVAASACSIVLIIGLMALSIYYHRRINRKTWVRCFRESTDSFQRIKEHHRSIRSIWEENIRSRLRLCRFVILWRRLLMKRIRKKRHQ